MTQAYMISGNEGNAQKGFVLIAAILAMMILTAVGIFALTTSSQDIKVSVRSVSEANALSAAEAGVHILCATFDPTALQNIPKTAVNGSVNASYSIVGLIKTQTISPAGSNITVGNEYAYDVYNAQVTGNDERLNGRVTLRVGITDAVPRSPN